MCLLRGQLGWQRWARGRRKPAFLWMLLPAVVVASAPNKWVQIPLEAWTRGTDRTQPFSLGQQKKATPLRYADHVGLPRAACGMVSSVGSRWY